jgi:hypothetical protein
LDEITKEKQRIGVGQDGNTYVRSGMPSVTTWAGNGSPGSQARWTLIDTTT